MALTGPANQLKHEARRKARQVARHPLTERIVRFGYIARGIVYLIPGILALELALGSGGSALNQTSAIGMIAGLPLGKYLLILERIPFEYMAKCGILTL